MVTGKGSATVTKETPDGASEASSETVDVPGNELTAVPQCEVTFGAGFTEPTKPYGNMKVYVQIKIPCDLGEQDTVLEFAEGWVGEKLNANMEAIKESYPD